MHVYLNQHRSIKPPKVNHDNNTMEWKLEWKQEEGRFTELYGLI